LIADSWALLLSSRITWDDFFAVVRDLRVTDMPSSWSIVFEAFEKAERSVFGAQHEKLVAQIRPVIENNFAQLGWDVQPSDGELTGQVRALLIGLMGMVLKDEAVIAEACRRFDANELVGDQARTILRIVARQDRPGDYETFLQRMAEATTPQDEVRYLYSLTEFRNEKTALDVAAKCFGTFRNQESAIMIGLANGNHVTGPAVWRYMVSRWDDVVATFPPNSIYRVGLGISSYILDPAFGDEVEAFHVAHPVASQRTILQGIEIMRCGQNFVRELREQL